MEYYWPDRLPDVPLLEGFQPGTGNNTIRTEMEHGPAKARRRTSSSMKPLTCAYDLRRDFLSPDATDRVDQLVLFYDFMEVVEGLSFWLPDPLDQSRYIKVRVKPQSEDTGVTTPPESATLWTVTLNLEVWPHAVRSRS